MTITASEIEVGTKLYEADGYPWEVAEIVRETEKTIAARICSEFSMFANHWNRNGGVIKTFRKSARLRTAE